MPQMSVPPGLPITRPIDRKVIRSYRRLPDDVRIRLRADHEGGVFPVVSMHRPFSKKRGRTSRTPSDRPNEDMVD